MLSRRGYALLLAFAVAIFLFDAWRHGAQVVDDAYIALRYSRSLVEGHGLVFNVGERVEGYTSLGFVLFAALCLKLGIAPIAAWKGLSLLAAAAAVMGATRLERAALRDLDQRATDGSTPFSTPSFDPLLSPLLLLPVPAFAYWAFGTLESMVFGGLLVWGLVLGLREVETNAMRGSAIVFALAYLTRPEAAPLFAVATVALALREWRLRRPDLRFLRRHVVNTAIVSATVAAHLWWRFSYYGDWRPNTYYAKVTGGTEQLLTGLQYAGKFALAFPVLLLALAVPLFLDRGGDRLRRLLSPTAIIAIVALALILLTIGLGGDSQPFFRFFMPVVPLLAGLAAAAARRARGRGRALTAAALALFAVHVIAAHATIQPYVAFVADRTTRVGAAVGTFFNQRLASDDLLATNTAGSLPYMSERPALDTLGLADAEIARRPIYISSTGWAGHRRGWGEYVLRRHPRVILFYNTAGAREPFYLGDRELLELPGFRFFYRLKTATLPALEHSISWPAARYPGFPFGRHPSGLIVSPDLGLEARFSTEPIGFTTFADGPITVTWFERDRRDDALWNDLGPPARDRVAAFVDEVAARWRAAPPPGAPDLEARAKVEALCDLALQAIDRGDRDRARSLLSDAAALNGDARSPRVFLYIANLAALTGDLHAALAAQKELLRFTPDDALARRNLAVLLTVPAAEFQNQSVQSSAAPGG
ncbi:MAG TPA: hypothetical protein VHR17_05505, partial [Thermoanaerobaculia bacterium]|nr:hypothetical protein [Thermoanaerobaculia bacterium]